MSDEEPDYDETELAQARALAAALEAPASERAPRAGEVSEVSEVGDLVETAEIVQLLQAPALSDERALAVASQIEAALARTRRRRRVLWASAAGAALSMAAAALLTFSPAKQDFAEPVMTASRAPTSPAAGAAPPMDEPAARQTLTLTQVAWLGAPSAERRELVESALRSYRTAFLDELERRPR